MLRRTLVISYCLLVIADLIGCVTPRVAESCPSLCVCDTWYELRRAVCVGRRLYSIHTDAPGDVQALDLSDNSISSLGNFEMANAGLTRLKYLNLSKNSIGEIGLDAFADLVDLTVLDLSRNHLYYLLTDTFLENRNLKILKLAGNNFNVHVPKLRSPWLTDLDIRSCRISYVPLDMFNGVNHLRNLDLANNLMIQLHAIVLRPLMFLRRLSLEGNPLSCNKATQDLRSYLLRGNVQYDLPCDTVSKAKKFEKMILGPITIGPSKDRATQSNPTRTYSNIDAGVYVNRTKNKNDDDDDGDDDDDARVKCSNAMYIGSPYWLISGGFLLGVAISTIISYCYFSLKCSCRRGRNYNEQICPDIQRTSLLRDEWYVAESVGRDDSYHLSCPGTPPPSYRDAISRQELYRAVHPQTRIRITV